MLFSTTFLIPFIVLARIASGSPVEERSTELVVAEGAGIPEFQIGETAIEALGQGVVSGPSSQASTDSLVTSRSEHNALEEIEERRIRANLILCSGSHCKGRCYAYSLANRSPYKCYRPTSGGYNSLIVAANSGLDYGVFVGSNCRGTLVPHVRTCYNIHPTGHTFFIN